MGLIAVWSSPYISYLTSPESHIPITMDEASWVVSLLNLGRLIGAISGSVAVNYLGTKTTVLVTSLPITLCWLFIIVANRVEWLYAARLLAGISLGKVYSCFSLYLGEIADPTIRGALVVVGTHFSTRVLLRVHVCMCKFSWIYAKHSSKNMKSG